MLNLEANICVLFIVGVAVTVEVGLGVIDGVGVLDINSVAVLEIWGDVEEKPDSRWLFAFGLQEVMNAAIYPAAMNILIICLVG